MAYTFEALLAISGGLIVGAQRHILWYFLVF